MVGLKHFGKEINDVTCIFLDGFGQLFLTMWLKKSYKGMGENVEL